MELPVHPIQWRLLVLSHSLSLPVSAHGAPFLSVLCSYGSAPVCLPLPLLQALTPVRSPNKSLYTRCYEV